MHLGRYFWTELRHFDDIFGILIKFCIDLTWATQEI